jgi:hypothetical protein
MQTYTGSCHCKQVRYQIDIDLEAGTTKCNCSFCAKVRNWSAMTKPPAFKLLSDPAGLGDYGFTPESVNRHNFCKHCGVRVFSKGHVAEIGGDFVSVMISTLDNLSDEYLAGLPVTHCNGRDNDWFHRPAVSAHL